MTSGPSGGTGAIRWSPVDLLLVGFTAILATVAVRYPAEIPDAIGILTAGLLVLYLVGYAVLEALLPQTAYGATHEGLRPVERSVLAVGLSVVIVLLVALVVEYSSLPLASETVLTAVGGLTVGMVVVAVVRRWRTGELRPGGPVSTGGGPVVGFGAWTSRPKFDTALDVALLLSLVFATASVGFVAVDDPQPKPFTELTLMTMDDSGTLVAGGYPTNLTRNQSHPTYLAIENREHRRVEYTVRVVLVPSGTDGPAGSDGQTLNQTRVAVAANESKVVRFDISPPIAGDELRVRYLLYKEGGDRGEQPYRSVSFPVDVSAPGSG